MKTKLGVAFGGGSGKGVAHLGIIKCLEEENIRPSYVTGTSIGALLGSLYAYGYDFKKIEELARSVVNTDEFKSLGFEFFKNCEHGNLLKRLNSYLKERFTFARMAMVPFITKRETLRKVVEMIVPDVNISELPVKFGVLTLDLESGNDVVIRKGSLIDAVMKSISIAGIFPSWDEDGKVLVDGGPTANVPVDALRDLGAEKVIGVNLSRELSREYDRDSALSINFRIDEIAKFRLNYMKALRADVLIEPDVERIHWADFSRIDFGIRKGYEATRNKMGVIRKLLKISLGERIKSILFGTGK